MRCAIAHIGCNHFHAYTFPTQTNTGAPPVKDTKMLIALVALTMSLAMMASALVIIHLEGQDTDQKKVAFRAN